MIEHVFRKEKTIILEIIPGEDILLYDIIRSMKSGDYALFCTSIIENIVLKIFRDERILGANNISLLVLPVEKTHKEAFASNTNDHFLICASLDDDILLMQDKIKETLNSERKKEIKESVYLNATVATSEDNWKETDFLKHTVWLVHDLYELKRTINKLEHKVLKEYMLFFDKKSATYYLTGPDNALLSEKFQKTNIIPFNFHKLKNYTGALWNMVEENA